MASGGDNKNIFGDNQKALVKAVKMSKANGTEEEIKQTCHSFRFFL